jgi:hydrogenase expression/formation protein HypE
VFGIDPLATIASGALLITCAPERAKIVQLAIQAAGITCAQIGKVTDGPPMVWETSSETQQKRLDYPAQDEIARLYEQAS